MADGHHTSRPPARNPERFSGETTHSGGYNGKHDSTAENSHKILSNSLPEIIGRVRERIALADEQSADVMPMRVRDCEALITALERAELRAIDAIAERDVMALAHLRLARHAHAARTGECAQCGGTIADGLCLECGEVAQ